MLNLYLFATGILMFGVLVWLWFTMKQEISRLFDEIKRIEMERMEERTLLKKVEDLSALQQALTDLADQRKERLLDWLENEEKYEVSIREAADILGISELTSAWYLDQLEQEGVFKELRSTDTDVIYKWDPELDREPSIDQAPEAEQENKGESSEEGTGSVPEDEEE